MGATISVYSSINGVDWTLVQIAVAPFLHQTALGQWGFSITISGAPVSASSLKFRYNDTASIASLEPGSNAVRIGEIEL